jgi:hypothetical protein
MTSITSGDSMTGDQRARLRKQGKVRAGFYRYGRYCIHRHGKLWQAYDGPKHVLTFLSLKYARNWAMGRREGEKP